MSPSQPLCRARAPAVSSLPRACRARRHPSASRYHGRVISFLSSLPRGPRVFQLCFLLATPRATRLRVDPAFPVFPRFSPITARRVSTRDPAASTAWIPCAQLSRLSPFRARHVNQRAPAVGHSSQQPITARHVSCQLRIFGGN